MSKNIDNKKKNDDSESIALDEGGSEPNQRRTQQQTSTDNFDINPIKKKCTYCNVEVVTYVEHESHPLFFIIALLIFVVFGFLSVIIIPLTYLVSKNAVHRCSRCLQKLGEKQCFGLPQNFSDDIWTFRLGKCSIVIARIYAIIILILFVGVSGYYVYNKPSVFSNMGVYEIPKESHRISITWEEFLKDCGGEIITENYVHARQIFNQKYEQNIVTWTGFFAEIKHTNALPFFASEHALNVLVKMDPTESTMYPDLVLSISSDLLSKKKSIFDSLRKGDGISFEAKMMSLGNEFKMHHLHALTIEKTGKFKEFQDIVVRESALP